jgi:hypothetical protein
MSDMWEEYYELLEEHAAGRLLSDQSRRQLKQVSLAALADEYR